MLGKEIALCASLNRIRHASSLKSSTLLACWIDPLERKKAMTFHLNSRKVFRVLRANVEQTVRKIEPKSYFITLYQSIGNMKMMPYRKMPCVLNNYSFTRLSRCAVKIQRRKKYFPGHLFNVGTSARKYSLGFQPWASTGQ